MPTGTVLPDPLPVLDGMTLPAMSIYIGGGPAGQGLLCQTGAADRPLIDATAPEDRPIAYFSVAIGGVGAVRPDVATVTLTTLSVREVFTPTLQGSTDARLLDLGGGWHTFASDTLFVGGDPPGSPASVTAVAYDSHGAEVDRRTLQMPTVG